MKVHSSPLPLPILVGLLLAGLALPCAWSQERENTAVSSGEPHPWPVLSPADADAPRLPGTERLTGDDDFADRILDGAHALADAEIEAARERRTGKTPDRERLREMLGLTRDAPADDPEIEYLDTRPGPRAEAESFTLRRIRWRAFREVHGYGLLLEPKGETVAAAIVIPDADEEPEDLLTLPPNAEPASPYATPLAERLAAAGVAVAIPSLLSRREDPVPDLSQREYLHRSAYELGRTLAGYELRKVLALAESFRDRELRVGVAGRGEGGRLALYAGAVPGEGETFAALLSSGYFAPREALWTEPADRNVFGLLDGYGDAELAGMAGGAAPGTLVIESGAYPEYAFRGDGEGGLALSEERSKARGKPGRLLVPTPEEFASESARIPEEARARVIEGGTSFSPGAVEAFAGALLPGGDAGKLPEEAGWVSETEKGGNAEKGEPVAALITPEEAERRQDIQQREIDRHNQWALIDSRRVRAEFFEDVQTGSLAEYQKSIEPYREIFREEVIGTFDRKRVPPRPRSRPYQEGEGVRSHEVILDVFPGLIAHGILTLPEDLPLDGSETRPVVVCQHGLEGRPHQVIGEERFSVYSAFATRLAQEKGWITFAPQNLYLGQDRFRMLQFKANSTGRTLFSFLVPQHRQIVDWLAAQPWVDGKRIAFYGLSYGGKSAMRIPALVPDYCLSICSADFNEWIWKNATTDPASQRYSYVGKTEYEMFEFDLGNTFNYAEMAALICPRPFMVERGHFDGVAPDEQVAFEYARVRRLYAARLGIGERTEIEWFPGPHKIHGEGTFRFLEKWIGAPRP